MAQKNHGSIEFLKFPNPQYPGDKTRMIKKWLRDSWARRKIIDLFAAVPSVYRKGTMSSTIYAYHYGYSWTTTAFRIFIPLQIASEVTTATVTGAVKLNAIASGTWLLGSSAAVYVDITSRITSMVVMPGRGIEIVVQGLTVPAHDAIVGRIQISGLTLS